MNFYECCDLTKKVYLMYLYKCNTPMLLHWYCAVMVFWFLVRQFLPLPNCHQNDAEWHRTSTIDIISLVSNSKQIKQHFTHTSISSENWRKSRICAKRESKHQRQIKITNWLWQHYWIEWYFKLLFWWACKFLKNKRWKIDEIIWFGGFLTSETSAKNTKINFWSVAYDF